LPTGRRLDFLPTMASEHSHQPANSRLAPMPLETNKQNDCQIVFGFLPFLSPKSNLPKNKEAVLAAPFSLNVLSAILAAPILIPAVVSLPGLHKILYCSNRPARLCAAKNFGLGAALRRRSPFCSVHSLPSLAAVNNSQITKYLVCISSVFVGLHTLHRLDRYHS
jgi:hypothetical protein